VGLTCSVQRRSNEAPFVPGIATRYRRYVAIEHDCLLGTDRALPAPIRQRPAGHSIAGGRPVVETYPCVGRQWLHVIRTGTSLRPTVINSWIPWTPKASAVGPVRCHGVRSCHEIRVPVKVSELNRQRPLSGIGGNLSSCPLRDLRGQLGNWLRCLDCGPSRRSRSGRRPPPNDGQIGTSVGRAGALHDGGIIRKFSLGRWRGVSAIRGPGPMRGSETMDGACRRALLAMLSPRRLRVNLSRSLQERRRA